ncbi:MAG: O-antigen ligase family protein, partial [Nostocaceae cyanobacterium]|nr:O-antigen ligase family protein [Nostocaceae cyanobacterium]
FMSTIPAIPISKGAIARLSTSLLFGGFLALSLFTFLPDSYGLMVQWPWVILWQAGLIAIAFWTLCQLRFHDFPLLGHHFDWAMALTLFSVTLSTILGYQPQVSVWYLVMVGGYGVVLYALNCWLTPPRSWLLLNWLGLCGLVTSASSLIYWGINRQEIATAPEQVNPFPLGHHNFVAGYLVLVLPVFVALAVEKGWRRWFWLFGTGITLVALYATGSRGGVLGLLSLLPVVLLVVLLRSQQQARIRWGIAGGLGILVLGVIVLSNPRVQRLITEIQAGRVEGDAQFRLFTMTAGLKIWQDHPVWGIGPGNIIKLYDLYRPIEAGTQAFRVQQLHSTPVNILAELGILGLGVYLLWIVLLVILGWRLSLLPLKQLRDSPSGFSALRYRAALYGCGAGLFAYTISSLTDYQLENIGITLTLVSFVAILLNLGRVEGKGIEIEDKTENAQSIQEKFSSSSRIPLTTHTLSPSLRRPLSLLGLALVLAALPVWVPVDAAMMLARSETASLKSGDFAGFYDQWLTAAKLVPNDPYYQFQIGAQLANYVQDSKLSEAPQGKNQKLLSDRARMSLQQAVDIVPTDELFNRVLGAFLVESDSKLAVKYLRRAAQLTPRKPYTYAMLGDAYLRLGNLADASKALALEGAINPAFFTLPGWQNPAVQKILVPTVQETVHLYSEVLGKISPNQPEYNPIYQNMVMLQWWAGLLPDKSEAAVQMQRLNTTAQALILIDAQKPDAALSKLSDPSPATLLLKAWIQPKQYFAAASKTALANLAQTIPQERQIRPWLMSLPNHTKAISARVGFFSYRNTNGLDTIEIPRSLPTNPLVNNLGLFNEVGYLPVFDQALVSAQKRLLHLDRPLKSNPNTQ